MVAYSKKHIRLRRAKRTRAKIRELGAIRLGFHSTNQHLYAQFIEHNPDGDRVLAVVSTNQKNLGIEGKNFQSAEKLGIAAATKANEIGIVRVAFDRGGNMYHGRVKSFAEAARKGGLVF